MNRPEPQGSPASLPSFVVVAVTYGRRWKVLREVLDAARQEGAQRAIVVDNAAADPIEDLARETFGSFVDVVRSEENTGSAGGFDMGLTRALETGAEYILLLDDDNKPQPGCMAELWRVYTSALAEGKLAQGKLDRSLLATLAFRPDYQPEVVAGGSAKRVNVRRGSVFGFHVRDIPFKILRRLPGVRARAAGDGSTATSTLPDRIPVEIAPWGGLFVHRSLVERFGKPNTGFKLYNDDFDYTWRITAAGGQILLCPFARVEDIDTSWNVKSRSSNSFDGWLTNPGDFRAYYSARNQTFFEHHTLPASVWSPLNRFVFFTLLRLRAWMKGAGARHHLLRLAVADGTAGRLGVSPLFPLSSSPRPGPVGQKQDVKRAPTPDRLTVAALVPTFNRAPMLRETLQSLMDQTRPPDEIIVINDGSTDETEVVVRAFGDRVRLLTQANAGKSVALNRALAETKADYIWICDDDDIVLPDGLKHMTDVLDAQPDVDMVYGRYRMFTDRDGQHVEWDKDYWPDEREPDVRLRFLRGMVTSFQAALVRRTLFEQVGPFRPELIRSQDYEMALRVTRVARAVAIPNHIFICRQHDGVRGSASASFAGEERLKRWLEAEKDFIRAVRNTYALEEFCPTFARGWPETLRRRASLLERGCVMACRCLWEEAFADFGQAATLLSAPLLADEVRMLETLLFGRLVNDLAGNPSARTALRALARSGEVGRQIVFSLLRPVPGLAKEKARGARPDHSPDHARDVRGALRLLGLMVHALGPVSAASRGLSVVLRS